jgi:hypothetical protein
MKKVPLVLLLLLAPGLRAEGLSATAQAPEETWAAPAALSPTVQEDYQPSDTYYAPAPESAAAATPEEGLQASYYSTAHIDVVELGNPQKKVPGVELFIDGHYVGMSPLDLSGYLMNKSSVSLSSHLDGYSDATRPNFHLPAQGEVQVVMANDAAVDWYTLPCYVLGLLMVAGGPAVYAENNSNSDEVGLGLVIGGLAVVLVSQLIARQIQIPAMRQAAKTLNAKPDPIP